MPPLQPPEGPGSKWKGVHEQSRPSSSGLDAPCTGRPTDDWRIVPAPPVRPAFAGAALNFRARRAPFAFRVHLHPLGNPHNIHQTTAPRQRTEGDNCVTTFLQEAGSHRTPLFCHQATHQRIKNRVCPTNSTTLAFTTTGQPSANHPKAASDTAPPSQCHSANLTTPEMPSCPTLNPVGKPPKGRQSPTSQIGLPENLTGSRWMQTQRSEPEGVQRRTPSGEDRKYAPPNARQEPPPASRRECSRRSSISCCACVNVWLSLRARWHDSTASCTSLRSESTSASP